MSSCRSGHRHNPINNVHNSQYCSTRTLASYIYYVVCIDSALFDPKKKNSIHMYKHTSHRDVLTEPSGELIFANFFWISSTSVSMLMFMLCRYTMLNQIQFEFGRLLLYYNAQD